MANIMKRDKFPQVRWLKILKKKLSDSPDTEILIYRWYNSYALYELWESIQESTSITIEPGNFDATERVPRLLKFYREEYNNRVVNLITR
jgi:hypothetical protein